MQAETFVEFLALRCVSITSAAAALVTVYQAGRSAVVSSAYHTLVLCYNSTDARLHTVAPGGSNFGQSQKIQIKRWSD